MQRVRSSDSLSDKAVYKLIAYKIFDIQKCERVAVFLDYVLFF